MNDMQSWQPLSAPANQRVFSWPVVVRTQADMASMDQFVMLFGTGAVQPQLCANQFVSDLTGQLAFIRRLLRLSVADMGRLFSVSRQTIYDWQKGAEPSAVNRQRIDELTSALQRYEDTLSGQQGRIAKRVTAAGQSVLDQLSNNACPQTVIGDLVALIETEASQRERLLNHLSPSGVERGAADVDSLA